MAEIYGARGVTIHRSGPGPKEPDAGLPPEAWGSRGVTITRTDITNTDLNRGTTRSPGLEPFAKGTW